MNSLLNTFRARATVRAFALEAEIARQVAYLKSLDDRLLADIGLNRSDIEAHVANRMHKSGRNERYVQGASPMLHSPVIAVAFGGVANVAIVTLLAYYPARWLGLW